MTVVSLPLTVSTSVAVFDAVGLPAVDGVGLLAGVSGWFCVPILSP